MEYGGRLASFKSKGAVEPVVAGGGEAHITHSPYDPRGRRDALEQRLDLRFFGSLRGGPRTHSNIMRPVFDPNGVRPKVANGEEVAGNLNWRTRELHGHRLGRLALDGGARERALTVAPELARTAGDHLAAQTALRQRRHEVAALTRAMQAGRDEAREFGKKLTGLPSERALLRQIGEQARGLSSQAIDGLQRGLSQGATRGPRAGAVPGQGPGPRARRSRDGAVRAPGGRSYRTTRQSLPAAELIVDEVGYLAYGTDAANMLFHVVNERHRRKRAMIFTTNKPVSAWGRVLHDGDLAHAIVDRVLERGRLLTLDGPSHRTKHLGLDDPTVPPPSQDVARTSGKRRPEFPESTTASEHTV